MSNKAIVFGSVTGFDVVRDGEKVEVSHAVNFMVYDSYKDRIVINACRNGHVQRIEISSLEAESIGLINLDVLKRYL